MKKLLNIALFTLLISSSLIMSMQPAPVIRALSENRIQTHQKNLEKKLAFHANIRGTLVIAGVAMTALSMYRMARELMSVTKSVAQDVYYGPVTEPPSWQTKATTFAKRFGVFCAETAGAIVVNNLLSLLIGKVMHDGSLAWLLTHHAPYQQTVELMEEIAFQYAHAMNEQDAMRHQKRFISAANALMVQFEQIIAFMRHKATVGTANNKTLKHEIAAVMSERMNMLGSSLQKAIDADNAQALVGLLKQFKVEFNQDLIRFAYNDQ